MILHTKCVVLPQLLTQILIHVLFFSIRTIGTEDNEFNFDTNIGLKPVNYPNAKSTNLDYIIFYCYSNQNNPSEYTILTNSKVKSIQKYGLQLNGTWTFIIHGFYYNWGYNNVTDIYNQLKTGILNASANSKSIPNNVIIPYFGGLVMRDLNISNPAQMVFYSEVARWIPKLGESIGGFIVKLLNSGAIRSLDDVHLVSFSMGAHVAGSVGNYVYNRTGEKIGYITGLDPGKNYFGLISKTHLLNRDKATFVDVMHVSIDFIGMTKPIGHVDYYPGGGFSFTQKYNYKDCEFISMIYCAHHNAIQYFIDSINGKPMTNCKCKISPMGTRIISPCYRPNRKSCEKEESSGVRIGKRVLEERLFGLYYGYPNS